MKSTAFSRGAFFSGKAAVAPAPQKFIRIVELKRKPTDNYEGYQVEVITVVGDTVTSRELVGKPNLIQYALADSSDIVDPRNKTNE